MTILYIGIGGAIGSISRYGLGKMFGRNSKLPVGTLIINISGAFLLGLVSNLSLEKNTYLFLAEGFLGAFTTFSTFMYEGFILIKNNQKMNIAIYIGSTVILGLISFALGFYLVN